MVYKGVITSIIPNIAASDEAGITRISWSSMTPTFVAVLTFQEADIP